MQSNKIVWVVVLVLAVIAGFLIFQKITFKPPVDVWTEPPLTEGPTPTEETPFDKEEFDFKSDYLGIKFNYPEGFVEVSCGGESIMPCLNDSTKTDRLSAMPDILGEAFAFDSKNDFETNVINDVVFDPSGLKPKNLSEFKPIKIGDKMFYKIRTGLFEGILSTSYYLDMKDYILAFHVTSSPVNWTSPDYNPENDELNKRFLEMLKGMEFTEPMPTY